MRTSFKAALAASACAAVLVLGQSPAMAEPTNLTLTPSTAVAGTAVTVEAESIYTATATDPVDVWIEFPAALGAAALSLSIDGTQCGVGVCEWTPGSVGQNMLLTAIFRVPATAAAGDYAAEAGIEGSDAVVAATLTLTEPVATTPPTTEVPTTTMAAGETDTAADDDAAAVPTAVPAGAVPTGDGVGSMAWAALVLALLVGAGAFVRMRRTRLH